MSSESLGSALDESQSASSSADSSYDDLSSAVLSAQEDSASSDLVLVEPNPKRRKGTRIHSDQPATSPAPPKMAGPGGRQAAHWCYTLNNPSQDMAALLASLHLHNSTIVYHYFQSELSASGTPHIQGAIGFTNRKSMQTIKRLFKTDRVHLEPTAGTPQQACAYASKDDTRVDGPMLRFGTPPAAVNGQGKRNDLLAVKQQLDDGKAVLDIATDDENFSTVMKYERSLQAYAHHQTKPRTTRTRCVVYYGSPGTYKSYSASTFANKYHLVRPTSKNGAIWFDGYLPNVHSTVVIDDFYGWIPYSLLLEMLDRYQCHVQRKGGVVEFRPKLVVITSNTAPENWYKYNQTNMQYPALLRRLDTVYHHQIMEAPFEDLPQGTMTVTADKGKYTQHPLFKSMAPVPNQDFFTLSCPFEEEDEDDFNPEDYQ